MRSTTRGSRLLDEAAAVVDATHPFAEEISRQAARACGRRGLPYLRYERPAGDVPDGVLTASDAAEAADLAVRAALAEPSKAPTSPSTAPADSCAAPTSPSTAPTIFLTVGSKSVATYADAAHAAGVRVVARVLPIAESVNACMAAGLEPRDIVAMQGPTSAVLDAALLRHFGARVLVTKESGAAGGFDEKLRAAELAGATAVVVARPAAPSVDQTAGSAALSMDQTATPAAPRADQAAAPAAPSADQTAAPAPADDRAAPVVGASTAGASTAGSPTTGASTADASTAGPSTADGWAPASATTPSEVVAWLTGVSGVGRPDDQPQPRRADGGTVTASAGARPARRLRRGILQLYTGDGKGKTTAAVGLALRARGAGLAVTFIQFVKGGRESSELAPLRAAGVRVVRPASARTGLLRDGVTPGDRAAAAAAWAAARAALSDPALDVVVLDELHAALRYGLVEIDEVLAALEARPAHQEVVATGRGAPKSSSPSLPW